MKGPAIVTQTATTVPTTTVATYSLASGTYFYDASGTYSVARQFAQQSSFAAVPQSTNQQIRPAALATQVHGEAFMLFIIKNPGEIFFLLIRYSNKSADAF